LYTGTRCEHKDASNERAAWHICKPRYSDSSSFDGNEKDAPEGGERDADEPGGVDKRRPLPHGCLQVIFKGLIAVLLLATLFGSYALPLSALAS